MTPVSPPARDLPAPRTAPSPVGRLREILQPDRGDLLAVLAYAVFIGALNLSTPIAVQALVNSIALGGLLQPLVVVTLLLLVALAFAAVLVAVQAWVVELLQRRVFLRTFSRIAARLPRVDAVAFDQGHGPELVNRIFDVVTVQKAAAKLLTDTLAMTLSVAAGLVVLAFYHPLLLAFDALLVVAIAALVLGPRRRGERTAIEESDAKYAMAAWLEDVAQSPLTFKAGGAHRWLVGRADELAERWVRSRRAHFATYYRQVLGALGLMVVTNTALLGVGGLLVIRGSLTLGQLVAAELIVGAVVVSVAKLGKHLETWYDLMAAVKKVGVLLDIPVESTGQEQPDGPAGAGALEARGLTARGDGGRVLLDGVDLALAPGEVLAITGASGSGKSVLLEVLWGLRTPDSGSLLVNDRPIADLSTDALRSQVGLVADPEIVHGPLLDNVTLRREGVTHDDARAALRAAGLDGLVRTLPGGLESGLGPWDRRLSDLEIRRVVLARALAGAPGVLLLDDLVDRLPPEERVERVRALSAWSGGTSVVVVSDDPAVHGIADTVLHLPTRSPDGN